MWDRFIVFSGSSGKRGIDAFPFSGTHLNDFLRECPICLLGDFWKHSQVNCYNNTQVILIIMLQLNSKTSTHNHYNGTTKCVRPSLILLIDMIVDTLVKLKSPNVYVNLLQVLHCRWHIARTEKLDQKLR